MESELKTIEQTPLSNVSVSPSQLIVSAMNNGADIEQLKQLYALQQEWDRDEARKAYHLAISEFKKESIKIIKDKKVKFGAGDNAKTAYSHASLSHIVDVVVPLLAKHSLSHSWTPSQDNGELTVTCSLTHSQGHSESVALTAPYDQTGSKNKIQSVGSSMAYLERYTFMSIAGLAAEDQDDDGANAGRQKGYDDGLNEGMDYWKACYKHKDVIDGIIDSLADDDLDAAAEYMFTLTNKELMTIRRAPTKGGCFSVEEMNKMKTTEWNEAKTTAIKNNPNVDRSI